MASLEPERKKVWKEALISTQAAWVACGISINGAGKSTSLEGMIGLVDWLVHGQVSKLVLDGRISSEECCLLPGNPSLKRPNFLLFPLSLSGGPQRFLEKVRNLGISEIVIAESTFPEDFLSKLKQTLKKEGIRSTKLEPES